MLDILQFMLGKLTGDAALAALMNTDLPITTIYTGPVDLVKQTQASLKFPLMTLTATSETFRTVPLGARDSRVSVDIWSRNSELEIEQIYERICTLLNFQEGDKNSTWVAWQRGGGLSSQYESDARLWHFTADFITWSV
jgi:hypothetical protein